MPRSLAPDDLYKLRIPTDPRISPDGTRAIVTVQSSAPKGDGYRHSLWVVPVDAGSGEPRQLTLGAKNDTSARWSPDGRSIAFLSDRRHIVEEEPDAPGQEGPRGRDAGLPAVSRRRRGAPPD